MAGTQDGDKAANTLSLAARTLSMHDDELPVVPQAEEPAGPASPFAVPVAKLSHAGADEPLSAPRGGDKAGEPASEGDVQSDAATATKEGRRHQLQQRQLAESGAHQLDGRPPAGAPRGGQSVKRVTPTTERTESDAADFNRQRVEQAPYGSADRNSGESSKSSGRNGGAPTSQRGVDAASSESDQDLPAGAANGTAIMANIHVNVHDGGVDSWVVKVLP